MSNGKLRLNLADLRLKSFETTESPTPTRGTVQGMEQCGLCTLTCGSVSGACYNASQTDSGCQDSWNGTCGDSCYGTCYENTCAATCDNTCCGVCGNTCCGNCGPTCCC